MAELYDQNKIYANRPQASSQAPQSADAELEAMLAELPPEEREAARASITAAPTGEDINRAMQERNANGEVFNMNLDQYRLWKSYNKTKEVDVLDTMGQAAEGVFNEIMAAAGSVYDKPLESTAKLTPSLVEAFAQGTRSLYGMAAQSQDPNSVFFRVKNAITANGDDEQAEFQQFMDAQAFNVQSMRLATGKETWVMDKDLINPEVTQVMSYIADPTLFVPFGGIAAKGARMIGMGETLAKASARASQIQRKVLGGALKWGVGAPIEFLGTATRNTIDYGLERAGSVFEVATGMPVAEARTTAQMYGWYTASAALEGRTVGLPIVGNIAGAMVGSTTARGVGEALTMVGEQIGKQQQYGRGVLSYAGQALRDANRSGVPLSKHAKHLLNVLDKVDPLFVYSADISKGAAEGMAIGAGLGFLSAGEEGAASGAGAGMMLGAAGAGMGAVVSDVGNGRLYDRIAVQRQMVIEGLRQIDPEKASAFEALAKTAELRGDRDLIAQVDGIITGIDVMAPDAKFVARTEKQHIEWLLSQKIDPDTGRIMEPLALFPEFGTNRGSRAKALSFLSMIGNRFDGDHKLLISELQKLPQDHSLRKHFMRLSGEQKKAVFDAIDKASTPEFKEIFGGKNGYEFYGHLNYAEVNVARINAVFNAGNKTQASDMIRTFLKDETGKDGKLTARGELLKQKLATEGYFDKDGNMRPSRLKDVEATRTDYKNAKGFVFRRNSTGQVEIHINLKEFGKETAPHELFHAVMMDSILKPDFIDRLSQNLLGKFDANGKRIENASVDVGQVKKFFQRYIDAKHGKDSQEAVNETARLEAAMKEYESRGTTNKIAIETKDTLEGLLEEFGAYYFGSFINDKPVDYLFRGGELGAMREIMGNAKQGFLDFWRSKIKGMNPDFNFDPSANQYIFQAFEKDGVRTKNKSLDLLMRDFVRATAMANKQGGFDISRLSPAARETFVKNNGIRGLSLTRDANGNLIRSNQRKVIQEQMRVGKEIYKILSGLDPKFRQGLITDGEGNLSGRLSPEAMEAMVQSGHIDRAWVDKIQQAYNIIDGNGGNVIHFGYLGRTAQIGDYAWPRLVGSDVPFKNRQAVLLGVDFKVGKDGKMYSLFHTLDKAVIDGRADVLWSDSAVRTLWNGDRGAMEADFFRYLANASKAAGDKSRVESAILLEDGTGAGARRRDVLHQMLGIVKAEGDSYLNKPIAEIPYGIRHSVTTFNVDGISNMRVGTDRWNVVQENAFKDLSRNFQPSEMAREDTPNGSIIKHPLGYKFAEKNGKVRAFDDQGNAIGVFDGIQQAAEAAGKHSVKQKQELIKSANEQTREQVNQSRKFQVLERGERDEAVRLGDVFEVGKVKRFTEGTNVIRQSRDEYVLDKAERELVAGSTAFYERLLRVGAEDLLKSLDIDERMKSAVDNFDAIKQKVEEASAMNDLAYRRGEKTAKQYTQDGEALLAEFKQAMKEKNLVEEQSRMIFNQNTVTLKTFLDMGTDGDWKQQIRNGEMPKLTDEGLEKLNDFVRKQIEAYRTNNVQGLPETISAHYSDEYNQQFKTGEAFTTVATHGTKSLDLMVAREFKREKLGTSFKIFSSLNAVFSAGQESTGRRYAGTSSASGTPLELVISNHSPEFVSAKQDLNVYVGYLLDTLLNSYLKDTLKPTYEQFKERFKFRTDEAARQAYEQSGNDFVVYDGKLISKSRLNESLETVAGYKFESEEFKDLLFVVENYHGAKLQEVIKGGDRVKEQEMINFLRRLIIRNANEKGTPPNTVYNTFGNYSPDATSLADSGGRGAARLISDAYYTLNTAYRTVGYSLDSSLGLDIFALTDPTSKHYEGVRNSVDANLNRIIAETKTVPMEVRTLVKMKNPLVIEGRKEYGEYFLKDIMEPAMKAGHDGVVFRNMRDGGKYDNIYAVFKDYMDANLMIIDTSFDDVKMPRGKDSEGNPVRYGKELGLRNQPTEGAGGFDFAPNSKKASDLLQQYLYGLKTGKTHQEMMTPELDYVFNNIEQLTKASNDDIVQSILRLGDRGKTIVDRLQNKEITLKQAVEDAKNVDEYTYIRKLKDIRDERKGLYNAFMRATGQMRKISDNDGRRYNTEGERESRNTRYLQPTEGEKAPVNWAKEKYGVEGYNYEVIWMTPERFLKLAAPLGERANSEYSRKNIEKLKQTLQREGSDMDMPHLSMKRNKNGELQVLSHEGRHRATAIKELYGDKKIPVALVMDEAMKIDNDGQNDWDYSERKAKLKPESERKKGTVSKEFKALEETPFLNEQGTARFQPAELEVLNITRTQDIPWFRNLIAGGSYVRYAGIEELNYLRGLQAVSHGADTLTGVDVNTTQGRRIVEGKGGLGYALNPNNEAAWASIGKGFIELINQTVQANLDKEGINQKTALLPLVFTTYRKNLNSVQGSEAYYNVFEILRRGQILSDKDLRIAMSKAVEKLYVNKKGEAVQSQTDALRSIVKNSKMNWDEMLAGIFATLADSDVQNFGTRGRMADDFFGAVWKRLDLSESKKKQIRGMFPEWKTVSKGDNITVEDMKTNVADITTDTLSKGLKNGDVYAILKFNDFVTDTKSNHRSYDTGVVQKDGKKPEIIILKKPVSIDDFYQSSVTSKGEQDLSNITDRSVKTNLLGMNARPYGQARVKLAGSVDFRDVAAKMQPSEGFSTFTTERTPTGVLLKNAAGYVISRVGSKYRVYNPYKAVIGVYDNEEQAKKRIYKEEPRR